jgi:hypothetical protein
MDRAPGVEHRWRKNIMYRPGHILFGTLALIAGLHPDLPPSAGEPRGD